MGRVLHMSPLGKGKKISKHVLIVSNVNSTALSIKGDANKPMNGPCQRRTFISILCHCWLLFWHWAWDLVTVSLLGFNICLVVGMAYGCALWSFCTCNSEVSTFVERTQKEHKKKLETVQVILDMGNGSTSNWYMSLRALCLPRQAFPWCSDENPYTQVKFKKKKKNNLIME